MPRRPPPLFWLAVRNIRCATLDGLHLPSAMDDSPAHGWLHLELHKPMPTSDFLHCLVTLVSEAAEAGESRVTCTVEMVSESPDDPLAVELQILPIRLNEAFAPKKGLGLSSNESAFQALAMQAPMYGRNLNALIERLEFAAEEDPEACERIPHGVPMAVGDGNYPELTYVRADLCEEAAAGDPESAPDVPDIEFDLIDGPPPPTESPRAKRRTVDEIFKGAAEFCENLRAAKPA